MKKFQKRLDLPTSAEGYVKKTRNNDSTTRSRMERFQNFQRLELFQGASTTISQMVLLNAQRSPSIWFKAPIFSLARKKVEAPGPAGAPHYASDGVHFILIKFQVENLPYIGLLNAITIYSNQLIILCTLIDEMYRFSVNNSIVLMPEPHGGVFITSLLRYMVTSMYVTVM